MTISGASARAMFWTVAFVACASAAQAAPPTTRPLVVRQIAEPPKSIAMSDSGLVAMIGAGEQVLIYDKITPAGAIPPPRKVAVGAQPRSVTFKKVGTQELLIVCCAGDRSIWLLDGKNGKLIRKIAAPGGVPAGIVAPASPDCAIAYVALDPPVGTLARLDLKAYKIGDFLQTSLGAFGAGAASPDGKIVYVTGPGEDVGNHLVPWTVPETGTTVTQARDRGVLPHGMMQVDAKGRFGIAGSVVTDLMMSRQSATLKGLNLLILPDQPVTITLDEGELVAYSTNSWTELKRLPLPAEFIPPLTKETLEHMELVMWKTQEGRLTFQQLAQQRLRRRAARGLPPVWSFYDRAAKSIVLINESKLLTVPLAQFALPKEPDLQFSIDAPPRVPVGKPWKATIDVDPKAELAIVEGPADVKVDGKSLTFDAKTTDIGPATLTIRASIGDVYHDETVQLLVSRPSVEVGVPLIDRFAVSPDGGKLLVRGRIVEKEGGPSWRFALIDLNTFQLIATRDITADIQGDSMALGNDLAVMALGDSDAFLALSAKDLSDAGRRFTKGRSGRLMIRGNELFAQSDGGNDNFGRGGSLVRYKLPDFEEVGRFEPFVFADPPSERSDPEHSRVPYRVREGTYFAGTIYDDEALQNPKMLVAAVGFLRGAGQQVPFLPNRWGVEFRGGELIRNSGQLLRKIPNAPWPFFTIHPDVPLMLFAAGATAQQVPGDSRTLQKFELIAHDLSDGDMAGSTLIAQEFGRDNGIPILPMAMTPKGAVVAIRDRVYLVDDADVRAIPTKPPLLVYPKKPQIVLSGPGPFSLEHVAENAEGAVKWTLRHPNPAITIDEKTGTVTVDASKLAAGVPDWLREWATAWQTHRMIDGTMWERRRTAAPPPPVLVDNYIKAASDRAQLLFGRPISGVPVTISVWVDATDARGRSNTTFYTLLLELPKADVMSSFK